MIDSHCHLDHDPLFSNLRQVIINSKREGIDKILTIYNCKKFFENIIKIKFDRYDLWNFGIHPHETSNNILEGQ